MEICLDLDVRVLHTFMYIRKASYIGMYAYIRKLPLPWTLYPSCSEICCCWELSRGILNYPKTFCLQQLRGMFKSFSDLYCSATLVSMSCFSWCNDHRCGVCVAVAFGASSIASAAACSSRSSFDWPSDGSRHSLSKTCQFRVAWVLMKRKKLLCDCLYCVSLLLLLLLMLLNDAFFTANVNLGYALDVRFLPGSSPGRESLQAGAYVSMWTVEHHQCLVAHRRGYNTNHDWYAMKLPTHKEYTCFNSIKVI